MRAIKSQQTTNPQSTMLNNTTRAQSNMLNNTTIDIKSPKSQQNKSSINFIEQYH